MTANLKRLAECDLTAQIVEDYSAAYGAQGSGPIPANADLVFQVELVDYKPATEAENMSRSQAIEPPTQ